jgi:hypothetical protein
MEMLASEARFVCLFGAEARAASAVVASIAKVADACDGASLGNKAEPMGDQNPKRNAEHCPNDDVKQNRPPIML